MKNIIILLIVFAGLFLAYRSCTKGYDNYAFFVHVQNEALFNAPLSPSDTRINNRGRKLKNEIIAMDKETDNGTGPNKGNLRWYGCSGIDCDEGWERSFLPKK